VPGNFEEAATITVAGPKVSPLARVFIAVPFPGEVLSATVSLHSVHTAAVARRRNPSLSAAFPSG
jgi:hypothetical protein